MLSWQVGLKDGSYAGAYELLPYGLGLEVVPTGRRDDQARWLAELAAGRAAPAIGPVLRALVAPGRRWPPGSWEARAGREALAAAHRVAEHALRFVAASSAGDDGAGSGIGGIDQAATAVGPVGTAALQRAAAVLEAACGAAPAWTETRDGGGEAGDGLAGGGGGGQRQRGEEEGGDAVGLAAGLKNLGIAYMHLAERGAQGDSVCVRACVCA